jgi:2-phospho-L-lactate guanylyltransferase
MLADVLATVCEAGHEPTVLSNEAIRVDAPVTVDEQALTPAINDALSASPDPVAIVMADLALATPRAVHRLCDGPGDVVVAPGRGGGTNALVVRHADFRVDYHGASYLDHLRIAQRLGATVREVDSARLGTDVDERADLAELLIHGDGNSRDWLVDAGFELDVTDGRVGVARSD